MLKPCAVCHHEAIHDINVVSCNERPMGIWWFCCYEHLMVWLTDKLWKRTLLCPICQVRGIEDKGDFICPECRLVL